MRRGHAENLVAEHYDALVNVAFHASSVRLGRHRRVLIAHGVVQRLAKGDLTTYQLFGRVLGEALAAQDRRRGVEIRGLRFFPATGTPGPLQHEEALNRVDAAARAAWSLRHRGGFDDDAVVRILEEAGVGSPQEAVAVAAGIAVPVEQIFDPCSVRLAPEWKSRRPRLLVAAILAFVMATGGLIVWAATEASDGGKTRQASSIADAKAAGPDPVQAAGFTAVPADQWRRTSKLDFSAWAPRGELAGDRQVQDRMWQFWQRGRSVTTATGTSAVAPAVRPALLYAGHVDGALVVIAYDGNRVARYTDVGAVQSLRIDRVDSADLMTSAAVVISRTAQGHRYLLAPWIAAAAVRDLAVAGGASRALSVVGGLTAAVPSGGAGCRSRYVLELRSSPAVAEKHAFVLADLGDMVPAHLTYMAAPSHGEARSPREVLSQDARSSWALHACGLDAWRNAATRIVNDWTFAEQLLPGAGVGRWACLRVDAWSGAGRATIRLEPPTGPALPVASAVGGSDCSRFSQNVVAATIWRSPARESVLLAAGSRHVSQLILRTNSGTRTAVPPLTERLAPGTRITGVQGRLTNGKLVTGRLSPALLAP